MKVLFNCSTNIIGGAIKNAAIFIKYSLDHQEVEWVYAVSPEVHKTLEEWKITIEKCYLIKNSPSKNIKSRSEVATIARDNNVNIIYTMAGPAYVKFDAVHVLGISNPYITHAGFEAFSIGSSVIGIIYSYLLSAYQTWHSKTAQYWVFQTSESRTCFTNKNSLDMDKSIVINNAVGNEFLDHYKNVNPKLIDYDDTIKIFCPAAGYAHKAIHLIPAIANALQQYSDNSYTFEFIITINHKSIVWKSINKNIEQTKTQNLIKNIGPFSYSEILSYYDDADIIFVPSIMETFSASYLEAFASKRPLIASNRRFSRDLCKEAAIYVDPFDSDTAAKQIDQLIRDKEAQLALIENGMSNLNKYGSQSKRVQKIVDYLENIFADGNKSARYSTERVK